MGTPVYGLEIFVLKLNYFRLSVKYSQSILHAIILINQEITVTTTTIKLTVPGQTDGLRRTLVQSWDVIQRWRSRARQRRHLARLTWGQLDDIGITSKAARYEIGKPFWRA